MRLLGAKVIPVESGTPDAQGRGQRGAARLGHQRAHDVLPARLGDGPASVSDDGARLPPRDRRGDARASRSRSSAGCPTAGRLRGRRLQRHRPLLAVHRATGACASSASSPAATASRAASTARRISAGAVGRAARQHELPAPERRRADGRGALDLGRPRLSRRGPRARVLQGPGPLRVRVGHRRGGARGASRRSRGSRGIMPALESAHAVAHAMRRRRADEEERERSWSGSPGRGDKDVHTVGQALRSRQRARSPRVTPPRTTTFAALRGARRARARRRTSPRAIPRST